MSSYEMFIANNANVVGLWACTVLLAIFAWVARVVVVEEYRLRVSAHITMFVLLQAAMLVTVNAARSVDDSNPARWHLFEISNLVFWVILATYGLGIIQTAKCLPRKLQERYAVLGFMMIAVAIFIGFGATSYKGVVA